MFTVDFSTIALGLIGIAAVFSSPVTAIINNRHLERMKRLEFEHADKLEREAREREIYEGYIRAAGACAQCSDDEALKDFGNHSALIAYYVPCEMQKDVFSLESLMSSRAANAKEQRVKKLSSIVQQLRDLRDKQSLP